MSSTIIYIDQFLTLYIFNLPHNKLFNSFFGFFSLKGMFVLVWILIFAYLFFVKGKRDHRFIIYFLVAVLTSVLTFTTMKKIIKRPRPLAQGTISNFQFPISNEILNSKFPAWPAGRQTPNSNYPRDFSFPSGHATTAFTSAGILSFFDKKRRKYFYIVAFLIAFSRIYLGYHYFLDALAGAFFGWGISYLILKIKLRC